MLMKNWIWNYSNYGPKISFFTGVSHSVIDMIKTNHMLREHPPCHTSNFGITVFN